MQKELDGLCNARDGNRQWQKRAVFFAFLRELRLGHEYDLNTWAFEVRHSREGDAV